MTSNSESTNRDRLSPFEERRERERRTADRQHGVTAPAAAAAAAAIIDRFIYVTRHGTDRISDSDDTQQNVRTRTHFRVIVKSVLKFSIFSEVVYRGKRLTIWRLR